MFVKYNNSWFKRAVAVVLAVTVAFVGLPFVGVDTALKASAETLTPGDGNITSTSTTSKYMGFTVDGNNYAASRDESDYKYTGRIKPVSVDMYDYLTDAEIANNNANWNNLNDSAYTWYNFYNPYNTFNKAVSGYTFSPYTVSPSEENITIVYYSQRFTNSDTVTVYLWDDDNSSTYNNSWPGAAMTYEGLYADGYKFTYTFSPTLLGFTPNKLIFSNNGSDFLKTDDISQTMQEGYRYEFKETNGHRVLIYQTSNSISDPKIHLWNNNSEETNWNDRPTMDSLGSVGGYNYFKLDMTSVNLNFTPTNFIINNGSDQTFTQSIVDGKTYVFTGGGNVLKSFGTDVSLLRSSANSAETITTTRYITPLYFGLFLQPGESYTSSTKPNTTGSYSTTDHYSNFWWQANMAQRNSTESSIQNVVDKNLTVNPTTKEKQLTQGGVELPYFSSAWADSNRSNGNAIMKYWKSTESDKISFPFYEVLLDSSKATGYEQGDNAKSETPKTEKARYYQFNSKDSTVYFNSANKQFVERDPTTQKIRDTNGYSGFFPYNDNNDSYGKYDSNNDYYNKNDGHQSGINNNYGFGAKFQMTFKLNSDGKVATVNENGESLEGAGRVNTRFEFTGDDDLWVFIDDHLVLDMGGAHAKSIGYIDFADKEAVAKKAISLGDGSGKDDLNINSANVGSKKVDRTNFTSLINGYTSSKGYDPTVVHTMTIFYMERGMSESNLKIRYNFDVEANFSKMKVKEQTDFSNVNAGLKDLTQKAAEDDVFQYTVKNQGTDNNNVLKTNTKYPTLSNNVRTVQGVNTKLTSSNNTTTSASHYFQPPNTTGNHAVGNVTYNWVDEYAGMTSKVGAGGITDGQGRLYLLHGTPKDGNTSEVKSSAEFEGQFDRYSVMQISQSNQLYKPNEHKSGNADNAATLSNVYSGRSVDSYYTTERSIFSTICSTPVAIADNVQFTFRNDIDASNLILNGNTPDENTESTVQMTELFVNTVKTGTLSITKKKTGLTTNSQDTEYSFKLTLTDVFGNSNVQLSSTDYQNIVISKSGVAGTSKLGADGTFTLKVNQTATITGVPYGTKFTIQEKTDNLGAETNYKDTTIKNADGSTVADTVINSDNIEVSVTNNFKESIDVTVEKKASDDGTDVSGAELELYYKETTVPETYSSNDPEIVPNKVNGMTVSKSAADVGIPGLQVSTSSYKYYTNTTSYTNPTVPSSSDKDWILPRNDTDYIYFRDYNIGNFTGEHDSQSFNNSTGKRSWLCTTLKGNGYGQSQEIDYTHNYWFAAQFSGNGKNTVTYAMWERFVDEYTTGVNTVVWKIQPPDGYTNVRFMLYDGSTCIRTTQLVKYELGKIYNKTSWGGWWASNDGKDCYFDVPCTAEGYWANTSDTTKDQRNTNSAMSQARKYTPTNDKIIFHCNSEQVWHNIHIEFFKSNSESDRVEGQAFPGYMMEPYAYAGSDYRLSDGFLTYELTIPEGATHFRINNGVSSGPYSYRTEIKAIQTDSTKKNGGNYFILGSASNYDSGSQKATKYNCTSGVAAPLYQCIQAYTDQCSDNVNQTYTTSDITSDYDYIYFENSDGWNKVYAYYYGGGNLRDDNWQRACYSSWPGIAPVGTDYVDGANTIHSNTYSINTTGDNYNGTSTDGTLSPEATFTLNGKTIYKFRLPKGDAKNYSKVIFNDGLKGGNETGVIDYQAGYIYSKSGAQIKHYENKPTQTYTVRTNSSYTSTDKTEYIYIKNTQGWDDPHITFYDSNGNQILQGGCGYVMDYAGKQDGAEYYRMPIPENAAKFSVNNGMGTASTDKYDIIRLGTEDGKPTSTQSANDKFVYELSGTALTRLGYSESTSEHEETESTAQTEVTTGYTVRQTTPGVDDTLNICDNASWNVPIGGISVTFYTSTGTVIGSGSYVMMKTNEDSDGKVWYTKKIPTTAAAFSVSYTKNSGTAVTTTTSNYPIYPTTADSNGNVTTLGNMYYKTEGTNKLSIINAESTYSEADDEVYQKRGDYLYLKCLKSEKDTYWKDMKVTFYANGDNIICSNVTAKFVNDDDDNTHSWYRVSIPTGAESFEVTGGESGSTHTTAKAEIFELKTKYSRYQDHYTLGNMQYELPSAGGSTSAVLLYPIFTKDDEYTLEVSDGNTISSVGSIIPVDAYSDSGAAATAQTSSAVPSPQQVLYETKENTVSYTWTGRSEGSTYIRLTKPDWMTSVPQVNFYTGSSWTGYNNMTLESGDTYIYNTAIPNNAKKIKFKGQKGTTSVETGEKTLPSDSSTKNYLYTITENTCEYIDYLTVYTSNMDHIIIHLWGGGDGDSGPFGSVQMAQGAPSGLSIPSGNAAYKYRVPSDKNYTDAIIFNDNGSNYWCMHISGMQNGGRGQVYYRGNSTGTTDSHDSKTSTNYDAVLDTARSYSANGNASYSIDDPSVYNTTAAATYQPEDRYGMISTLNSDYTPVTEGTADENNFIYISTEISDPYIMFYSNTSTTIGGSSMAMTGISLKGATLDGTDIATETGTENLYKIRLPKDAQSFVISNGDTTLGSNLIPLTETIYVKSADGTLCESNEATPHIQLDNYRHAGTTFTIGSDGAVTGKKLRANMTYNKQSITDPLNPRTDADYIFFTDSGNTFGGSGTPQTVYAYYYGGADGEYTAWPGIQASTADDAPLVYTDNSGRKVYMFRLPSIDNGKYPYVIFNNGSDNSRKVTQAISIMNDEQTAYTAGGNNYILNSGTTQNYGTYDSTANSTNYVTAYSTSSESKIIESKLDYNSSGTNKYIYIINNGTTTNTDGSERNVFDDMHVMFYDSNKYPIGSYTPGYKPDKIVSPTSTVTGMASGDVYRIQIPSNAVYFQINNGTKGTGSNDYERQSEIKQITPSALYQFVPSASNAADYIEETDVPSKLSDAHFLLDIVNRVTESEEEIPETETIDIHIATVVTKENGDVDYIKWVKDYTPGDSPSGSIDTNYIANTETEIGESAHAAKVKVKKEGEYYWKESVAPSGYKISNTEATFQTEGHTSSDTSTITDDPNPTGSLTLNKKLYSISNDPANTGEGQEFTFTVTLTAPVGTDWSKEQHNLTYTKGGNSFSPTTDTRSATSLTRVITMSIPADGTYVKIDNIPSGTYYYVTETAKDDYLSTPVYIYKDGDTTKNLDEISGTIPSEASPAENNVSYYITNKREVGSLTLAKTVEGSNEVLGEDKANVTKGTTEFPYTVTLKAPDNVDLRNYLAWSSFSGIGATITKVNGSDFTSSESNYNNISSTLSSIEFTVKVRCDNGSKTIVNLPIGTKYTVTEQVTASGDDWRCTKSGEVTSETAITNTNLNPVVTIKNKYTTTTTPDTSNNEIILTKIAKDSVGTTPIGAPLAGAGFKLVKVEESTEDDTYRFKPDDSVNATKEYTYAESDGTYNQTGSWLTTGADGKLHIKNLPDGDYYLVEQTAPSGYSVNTTHFEFNVNGETVTANGKTLDTLTCYDEMAPAYIKLYEHINERRNENWGDPTFIFKITQTKDAAGKTILPADQKTRTVALTFDDDGGLAENAHDTILGNAYDIYKYIESTDEVQNGELEYQGMYHIDDQGRIKLEPGTYTITRIPVSRYEFVADTWKLASDNTANIYNQHKPIEESTTKYTGQEPAITNVEIPKGETALVHYYDKVAYYDKFTHVDTKINQFYKLNETPQASSITAKLAKAIKANGTIKTTKTNVTIKGIRVEYTAKVPTSSSPATIETTSNDFKAWYIFADGTEGVMDTTEKAKIKFITSDADATIKSNLYPNGNKLTISNPSDYASKVYTIKASYTYTDANTNRQTTFTTNFDIAFAAKTE